MVTVVFKNVSFLILSPLLSFSLLFTSTAIATEHKIAVEFRLQADESGRSSERKNGYLLIDSESTTTARVELRGDSETPLAFPSWIKPQLEHLVLHKVLRIVEGTSHWIQTPSRRSAQSQFGMPSFSRFSGPTYLHATHYHLTDKPHDHEAETTHPTSFSVYLNSEGEIEEIEPIYRSSTVLGTSQDIWSSELEIQMSEAWSMSQNRGLIKQPLVSWEMYKQQFLAKHHHAKYLMSFSIENGAPDVIVSDPFAEASDKAIWLPFREIKEDADHVFVMLENDLQRALLELIQTPDPPLPLSVPSHTTIPQAFLDVFKNTVPAGQRMQMPSIGVRFYKIPKTLLRFATDEDSYELATRELELPILQWEKLSPLFESVHGVGDTQRVSTLDSSSDTETKTFSYFRRAFGGGENVAYLTMSDLLQLGVISTDRLTECQKALLSKPRALGDLL